MAEKYVRVGGRGTSRRIARKDDDAGNWSGDAFRKYQEEKKKAASSRFISVERGTGKIKFSDIATTSGKPSGKGMWVRTGRGTGKRRID